VIQNLLKEIKNWAHKNNDLDSLLLVGSYARNKALQDSDIDLVLHIRFLEMDATKMHFEDNEFDIVLSFGIMHHIGCWEKALEEISRVLKPQGFFIFGDLAYSKLTTRIFKPIVKNYGVYTIDELIHCLRRNNFEIIYREEPKGVIMKYYSLVFQKIK